MDTSGRTPTRVPDFSDPHIQLIRAQCGERVAEDLMRAVLELEDHNPSGRCVLCHSTVAALFIYGSTGIQLNYRGILVKIES